MTIHHYRSQSSPRFTSPIVAVRIQSRPIGHSAQPLRQQYVAVPVPKRSITIRTCLLALVRRPLVLATLALVGILGIGTINEAVVTAHINAEVQIASQQNDSTRTTIQQLQAQIIGLSSDTTVITRAQQLGYYLP